MATQKPAPKKSAQRKATKAAVRKARPAPKPTTEVLEPDAVLVRTSERGSFRRCRQQWWWAWREGLRGEFTAGALWFGEGIHYALAEYYQPGLKRGPHPAGTFADWVGDERRRIWTVPNPDVDETKVEDALDLGVAMLTHYIEHYGKDPRLKFIKAEQTFQLLIPALQYPDPDGPKFSKAGLAITTKPTLYSGTFDGVFRDQEDGKPWLIEHKTASAIQTGHLPLDDQAGSYWAVATDTLRQMKLIKPTEELEGIRYNFLRKAMPDQRPINAEGERLNKDGSVSARQPVPYFHREPVFRFPKERASQLRRIQEESHEMQLVRQGILPVIKSPTKDCQYSCSFFNMCQLHEAGDDWESYRDMMYKVEDPYAAHRKSAAEGL